MKVLHLIASVNPETGGPTAYAINMAEMRRREGHESVFVTLDDPQDQFLSEFAFPIKLASHNGSRFSELVADEATRCDVAIVHGLWNNATIRGHTALVRTKTPWVLFPHGMMDPYFRRAKPFKHAIKQIYWWLFQGRTLSGAYRVMFTSEEERRLSRGAFIGHQDYSECVVAYCAADQRMNDHEIALTADVVSRPDGEKYLLYLSRIHPKKAVDNLLEAFATVRTGASEYSLVIAGPDEGDYAATMKRKAEELGVSDNVFWPGMVRGAEKKALFRNASAFVLPSHQENFGQVVAEALSAGTPALISRKVNIWREICEAGAGMACDDTVEDTARMLRAYIGSGEAGQSAMREAARPCYERYFSVESAAEDLHRVLTEAATKGRPTP